MLVAHSIEKVPHRPQGQIVATCLALPRSCHRDEEAGRWPLAAHGKDHIGMCLHGKRSCCQHRLTTDRQRRLRQIMNSLSRRPKHLA